MKSLQPHVRALLNPNRWSKMLLAWMGVLVLTALAVSATQAATGYAPKATATPTSGGGPTATPTSPSGGTATPTANPGTTFYVDSVAGNDANNGTSTSTPWRTLARVNSVTFQPGDHILFKAGSIWTGTLAPRGSGSAAAPIILSNYGTGNLPVIAGAGASDTLYLFNQQYWEISNLEITNTGASVANRRGIHVVGQNAGQLNHIYLRSLNIHDVNGDTKKNQGASAGIQIEVIDPATVPTWFNDVLVENNTLVNVDRLGIHLWSEFFERPLNGTYVGGPWTPSTNVVFRNNYLQDIGGDAVVPHMTDGALMEYNVVDGFNAQSLTDNNIISAGIWVYDGDHALMQYNEAFHGHTDNDGMAYDLDSGTDSHIYQYNYSHDNDGGFELVCSDATHNGVSQNHITRYNISQNDGNTRVWRFCGLGLPNMKFYNNVIYVGAAYHPAICYACKKSDSAYFWNNIFYILGPATWGVKPSGGTGPTDIFDYNIFYGVHPSDEPPDAHKITADPLFVAPGTGGNGISTLNGYKLRVGSPALGSGLLIPANGGKDFWGNAVSSSTPPNRGAYNGPGL
jgi:hypothetical protein